MVVEVTQIHKINNNTSLCLEWWSYLLLFQDCSRDLMLISKKPESCWLAMTCLAVPQKAGTLFMIHFVYMRSYLPPPPACCSQAVSRQVVYAALAAWKWCDKNNAAARIHTTPVLPFLLSLPLSLCLALRGRLVLNALAGSDTVWRLGMQEGEILLASVANYNLCSHLRELLFLSELYGPGHAAFRLFSAILVHPNPKGNPTN